VSDNASEDDTAQVVAAFRERRGVPTVYSRNDENLGVGRNIARAAEIASGGFCWLVGSDDHLSADALDAVFGLIGEHPYVSGITVPRDNFTSDMRNRIEPDRDGFYPETGHTTVFEGADEVLANLGQAFCYLSIHVVRRERLLRAVRDGLDVALSHPIWPQIYLLGLVAVRDPTWLWYPTPLVKARSHRSYLGETGEAGTDLASVHASMVRTLGDVWEELTPAGGRVYRVLIRRSYSILAMPDQVDQIKRREDHSLKGDLRMLLAFTQRFWRLRQFWRATLPSLLVPYRVVLLRERVRRRRLPRSTPLPRGAMRARVSADVPVAVPIRAMVRLATRVTNAGDATFVSSPPNPVHVSYQWRLPNGDLVLEGLRTELPGPLPPGEDANLTLRVLTPWDPGDYVLRLMLVQELVAWFDEVHRANALETPVRAARHDDL
jgi:glycosyltransferase involved in cell wall biosynthesis